MSDFISAFLNKASEGIDTYSKFKLQERLKKREDEAAEKRRQAGYDKQIKIKQMEIDAKTQTKQKEIEQKLMADIQAASRGISPNVRAHAEAGRFPEMLAEAYSSGNPNDLKFAEKLIPAFKIREQGAQQRETAGVKGEITSGHIKQKGQIQKEVKATPPGKNSSGSGGEDPLLMKDPEYRNLLEERKTITAAIDSGDYTHGTEAELIGKRKQIDAKIFQKQTDRKKQREMVRTGNYGSTTPSETPAADLKAKKPARTPEQIAARNEMMATWNQLSDHFNKAVKGQ